jgi:hypothetical protein
MCENGWAREVLVASPLESWFVEGRNVAVDGTLVGAGPQDFKPQNARYDLTDVRLISRRSRSASSTLTPVGTEQTPRHSPI